MHDRQDEERLSIVRAEIDQVFDLQERVRDLVDWTANRSKSPESRLLARAMAHALWEAAAEGRRVRPHVDLGYLDAAVAGLDSVRWRDPAFYDSLLAPRCGPDTLNWPVRRPQPLD